MKKKILIPISFAILLITLIVINVEKASAGTGMCTYKAKFFYNEAYDTSHTGVGTTVNNTSWEDPTASSSNRSNASYEINDMTVDDCISYVNDNTSFGTGASSSICTIDSDGSMKCGDRYHNSGSYETGLSVVPDLSGYLRGDGTSEAISNNCKAFVDSTIKPGSVTIKENGVDKESGKVKDEITRLIDYDTGKIITLPDGSSYKFSAQVVTKTWTAPCDVEPEDKECSCSGSGGGGGGTNMNTCGGTITNSVTGGNCGSIANTAILNENDACGVPVVNWSVTYTITETITISVLRNPNPIYAGGGIGLKINQNSSTSTAINKICVSTTYGKYICPQGGSQSKGTCTIHHENCYYDDELKKEVCDPYDETYAATCSGPEYGPGDYEKAMNAARSAAASAGGSKTPEPITVSARKSNDEKDGNSYDLSTDVGQGKALTSTKNNYTTGITGNVSDGNLSMDDVMGTANVMQSSINQACINRHTGMVRYIENGNCSDDEVDGGHKYYVPLKWSPTKDGDFKFHIHSGNISTIATSKLDADCPVKVNQKLYDDEEGGGYKFIYRPVDLAKPTTTVFPSRKPGANWVVFKNTSKADGTGAYDKAMKRNKTEYFATLNSAAIQNIKNINEEYLAKNMYYNSLNTIHKDGTSTILQNLGVNRATSTKYNKLGECNRKTTISKDGTTTELSDFGEGTECW